jgi:cysteinyl-tRNA synthetase
MLNLYDNFTRSLRPFEPLHPRGEVGLYTCGPTVYDYQHIGNYRTFLFEDVLKRVLAWNGYRVRHVMNITDVGHLTSDADTGEDKMEKGARRTGKSAWEIAQMYTESFLADMKALNIGDPTILCRATDHIAEQVAFIADIEKNGYAYRTSDGVYFDTSRQPDYGYLARLDVAGLEAGKRVEQGEKRHPTDFALWKFSPAGETRQMEWDSPWGRGFPGWHIECSAMAQKYLGDYFDIHCGGEDHIPVHHTNEIAQTEARVGTRLANFWLHGYFLLLSDAKMAKSAGEFLRVLSLQERGYDPLAYRYLCLTAHYRGQLNFTWDALDAASTALDRMRNGVHGLRGAAAAAPSTSPDRALVERFTHEINDDLNLPRALAVAWEALRGDLPDAVRCATLLEFDRVFGLGLATWEPTVEVVPAAVTALADARAAARAAKNWVEADRLRGELHAAGWEMEDRAGGYALKRR